MPIHRRLPKVGFTSRNPVDYSIVNLSDLEEHFNDGDTVDYAALQARGLTRKKDDGVKILGGGEITKKLTVQATKFSKSAEAKIVARILCDARTVPTIVPVIFDLPTRRRYETGTSR